MAQHQTHIPADMNGVMEIFWDPCAPQKCIKGIIQTPEMYNDLVITGFTLQ